MTTTVSHRVLPWLRTGLAAQITAPAAAGVPAADTTAVSVSVELHASGSAPAGGFAQHGQMRSAGLRRVLYVEPREVYLRRAGPVIR